MPRLAVSRLLAGLPALGARAVSGQAFPANPVRLLTAGPGSSGDFASRLLAQGPSATNGQQVIVDNRNSGVILVDVVAKAPPIICPRRSSPT